MGSYSCVLYEPLFLLCAIALALQVPQEQTEEGLRTKVSISAQRQDRKVFTVLYFLWEGITVIILSRVIKVFPRGRYKMKTLDCFFISSFLGGGLLHLGLGMSKKTQCRDGETCSQGRLEQKFPKSSVCHCTTEWLQISTMKVEDVPRWQVACLQCARPWGYITDTTTNKQTLKFY